MNNENKELILDVLEAATGIIDELAYYFSVSGSGALSTAKPTITWAAAADGSLAASATIDFENTSGVTIQVLGVALLNSNATSLTTTAHAVAVYAFPGGSVALEDGEILRINTLTLTVD